MKKIMIVASLLLTATMSFGDWGIPQNLGPGVNTSLFDYAPSLSVTQDTLYFTRLESNGEDYTIYTSVFRGGAWDSAVSAGDSINTPDNGEGSAFISYDGRRLYFGRFPLNNHNDAHIYYSERRNGVWQSPRRFEAAFNNDPYSTYWPCFTHDGRRLYFYSFNRPGGRGNGDLWYSDYDTLTQTWGPPVNLGDSINTSDWDFCPTLSWDDRTLYFHSARAPTNKSKIYKSRMVNGVWQKWVVLPEPINWDLFMANSHYPCLSADGKHLLFGAEYIPFPNYGLFDVYDSQWVLGVELSRTYERGGGLPKLAFPNPLTPGSRILFMGSYFNRTTEVVLYDVRGKRMRSWSGPGFQSNGLFWDGQDGSGMILPSGVYFIELSTDGKRVLSKAVVLR